MAATETKASALARFVTRVPLTLSRRLWVWPLLGALILGGLGFWVHSRLEESMQVELSSRLQTLLNADIAALRLWFSEKQADAKSFAGDVRIQEAIVEQVELSKGPEGPAEALADSAAMKALQQYLKGLLEAQQYLDYVVIGADKRIIASPHRFLVGRASPPGYEQFLQRALGGRLAVSRPFAREMTVSQRAAGPTMFVAAPVKAEDGKVVAVLALRMRPEAEFSQIFSVARMGETGEAYAFDRRGVMLTASRFEGELKTLGLIPDSPEATAILNVRLADPGAPLTSSEHRGLGGSERGGRRPREELPLTRMAQAATKGWDGYDVQGYRNYRGVNVVGAWAWLPEFGMGVATEVTAEEAFQTLYMVRRAFLVLFVSLVFSGGAIFGFTVVVDRLQRSLRRSAVLARRLGQYVLVQEIGRGANGMVYRARHSLLRRPVAVKLLSPELTNDATAAARFEHEVQMTSQLTHPNTVSIYDYGRTPEGLFYYAMEFLSGIDLDVLVRQFGPQSEGRTIHILRQICGSLAEAHRIGLIHRDVKPANVVLTRRGGVCDVVKVLDFGLVKAADGKSSRSVVGTPHFMPPEAVDKPESVDARSDLYSVGAVGYWLLTGKTLFDAEGVEALLARQVKEQPLRPSERAGLNGAGDLEEVIMRCLQKRAADRPQTAEALDETLGRCAAAGTWTPEVAEEWWRTNAANIEPAPIATTLEKTLVIAPRT